MRGHDSMPEIRAYLIKHANNALDMRLVDASENVVEDQHRFRCTVTRRQGKENAKAKRIEMRLAEIGLGRSIMPLEIGT